MEEKTLKFHLGSLSQHYRNAFLQICVCENRIAAINDDGSVLVWEKEWKTLHFQKTDPEDKTFGENLSEDCHSTNDKVKESTNVNISVKSDLEQTEYEGMKKKDVENSSHDKVPDKLNEKQENTNKRIKLETFAEKADKCPVSDISCLEKTKINFSKVTVEDNSLLALDTGKEEHKNVSKVGII